MKKYVLTLFALILLAGTSCQEKIDIEKEKEAIKAIIEEETNAFIAGDFARLSETYLQDENNIRLTAGENGYVYHVGWEDLSTYLKDITEGGWGADYENQKYERTDYTIKVYNKSAWAVFNENWEFDYQGELTKIMAIGVRFLEKVDGEWKFIYMSMINKSSYEDEDDAEEIEEGEGESETEETE